VLPVLDALDRDRAVGGLHRHAGEVRADLDRQIVICRQRLRRRRQQEGKRR
jgi:hypothetical protein